MQISPSAFRRHAISASRVAINIAVAGLFVSIADPALAQNIGGPGTDPFIGATTAAKSIRQSLTNFALAIGGVGLVACLLLGFFGKLNWKWVWTGVGVSFAIAIVPTAITWLAGLAANNGA